MQRFIVTRSLPATDKGFTLLEIAVIVVILGVMSAIAGPSMLTWYKARQVDDAVDQLQGALQEAQREAMKQSRGCELRLVDAAPAATTVDNPTIRSTRGSCLPTGPRILTNISLSLTGERAVTYTFKGNRLISEAETTVFLRDTDNSIGRRCLVVSQGLGVIRTGTSNDGIACTTAS